MGWEFLTAANEGVGHTLHFQEARLDEHTVRLADGYPSVCAFVHDTLDSEVLKRLAVRGFGCRLVGYDPYPSDECRELGLEYLPLDRLLARSDVITIHCPLTPDTFHLIDGETIARMKRGVMLINTSRGRVLDTRAVIAALKAGQIGYLGMDVYEEEEGVFFQDLSNQVIQARTTSFRGS